MNKCKGKSKKVKVWNPDFRRDGCLMLDSGSLLLQGYEGQASSE